MCLPYRVPLMRSPCEDSSNRVWRDEKRNPDEDSAQSDWE